MYYGHMGVIGGFSMILFWGLFVWLIVWLITQNNKKDEPELILRRRYANGELTKKQFEEMKKNL